MFSVEQKLDYVKLMINEGYQIGIHRATTLMNKANIKTKKAT
jgi:hypothetical protein